MTPFFKGFPGFYEVARLWASSPSVGYLLFCEGRSTKKEKEDSMSGVHYLLTSVSLPCSNLIYWAGQLVDYMKISMHLNLLESLDPLENFLCDG